MYALLHKTFVEKLSVTPEEFAWCQTLFKPRTLKKRQYLLQEGNVCEYQAFVEKGILRSYTVDEKGAEHILQFASEGWWMADLSSYITGEPSLFNMEALEDAELLLLSRPDWDRLMQTIPRFEHYFRILIQNHLISTQKRLMGSLAESAQEKYLRFANTYPDCVQRVSQQMIAAFLGVSRETLSRLRRHTGQT